MRLPNTTTRPTAAYSAHFAEHPRAQPADRLVLRGPHGAWEVRTPNVPRAVLRADSRAAALQWAWNITRDTGGRVLTPHHDKDRH